MRRIAARPLAVAALVAAALPAAQRELRACSEGTRTVPGRVVVGDVDPATRVRGRIVSATGGVIPGACAVVDLGVAQFPAGLDAGGVFDVAIPASTPAARVLAVAPMCVPGAGTWFAVAPERGADAGTLRLEPCVTLRGRVLDEQDAPVPAALLEFGPVDPDPSWALAVRTFGVGAADGDQRGEFVIDVRPSGALALRARSATHEFAEAVAAAADARVAVLRGQPHLGGPRLDVYVRFDRSDDRTPFDGVVAEGPGTGFVLPERIWTPHPVLGDPQVWRFPVALPATLRLVADEREPFAVRLDRMPRGPVRFPLRPRRNTALGGDDVVRGVVTVGGAHATWSDGTDGGPPHGHRLVVVARRRPDRLDPESVPALHADATTRSDGSFEISGLVRGNYAVRVEDVDASFEDPSTAPTPGSSAAASANGTFRVEAGRREDRVVVLDLASRLRAAPDLLFECAAATSTERLACEVTTEFANPIVRVRRVPPGETIDLSVRVRAEGRWTRRTLERIAPDRLAAVPVPDGGRIRCRVLAGPDGPPAPGVEVTVKRYRSEPGDVAASDAAGRIDLSGFEAGAAWTVSAHSGAAAGWAEVRAGGDEATIVLTPICR